MKLTGKKVDDFFNSLKNNDNECKLCLFFGQDESVISTKAREILNIFKHENIINISQEEFKNKPSRIFEEFQSISFFADRTIIVLKLNEKPNDATKYIKQIFEKVDEDNKNFILIITGDLATSSSLRKFCEENNYTASIGCYNETNNSIINFIKNKLGENELNFNQDVVNKIYSNIGSNLLVLEKEIEKISLYKGNNKDLTIEDVEKITTDISDSDTSEFINCFCILDKHNTFKSLNKLLAENQNIILTRSLISHFLLLQRINYRISKGEDISSAIKSEKVFWKEQLYIKKHLEFWDLKKINFMLEKFIELEKTSKFSTTNIEFEEFILKTFMIFKK